jgi:hypothetical protein
MKKETVIYAFYNDDDVLLKDAQAFVSQGLWVSDVFSPFPIHGLDPIIGVKESKLGYAAFAYGLIGLTLALLGMWYFMIHDWPMNIGGKPNFEFVYNLPAFVPVAFEFTVLCTAHGLAFTYFCANGTFPGVKADNPDPRTTDDLFAMEIKLEDNPNFSLEQIKSMLSKSNASEIREKQNCETDTCCNK